MSALAMGLLKKGCSVSGSDLVKNDETNKLEKLGAVIFTSQVRQNIEFVTSKFTNRFINFVVSSAIKPENEEFSYCKEKNLSIKHRSEILAMLMRTYTALAVAGSHGKTSTSTFLSTILELCTRNSSSITGGIIPIYNSNCHLENTKYLVAEVDESDGTIDKYKSDIGIINNIDFDHCDHFSNLSEVISSFKSFAKNSKKLLLNFDCETSRNNFNSNYKWSNTTAKNVAYAIIPTEINSKYTIGKYYENGNFISSLNIPIPGLHNLSNITAAIAASRMIGVDFIEIKKNLKYLKLPKKRFEFRGQIDERSLYDDYAHHPNEIKETIKLGRLFIKQKNNNEFQKNRLVALFQPHRYSRVKQFNKEFAEELSKADVIYVTSIYGAGEGNEDKITSKIITDLIYKTSLKHEINILDLRPIFLQLKDKPLYFKTDTHWNKLAASIAYEKTIDELNKIYNAGIQKVNYNITDNYIGGGDLSRFLKISEYLPQDYENKYEFDFSRNDEICIGKLNKFPACKNEPNREINIHAHVSNEFTINSNPINDSNLLFVGDSYSKYNSQLFNFTFSTIIRYSHYNINGKTLSNFIKNKYQPNIAIYSITERQLYYDEIVREP